MEDEEVIFRRNGRGIGYRTNEAERDTAIAWYVERIGGLFWFGLAGFAAVILIGVVGAISEVESTPFVAILSAALGLALWLYLIETARRVPERVLMRREKVGLRRGRKAQLPWIQRIGWSVIWLMAAIAGAPLLASYLTAGDAELPIKVTSGAALLFVAYLAIRKAKLADAARTEV